MSDPVTGTRLAARLQHMPTVSDLWEAYEHGAPADCVCSRTAFYAAASGIVEQLFALAQLSEAETFATLETWKQEIDAERGVLEGPPS